MLAKSHRFHGLNSLNFVYRYGKTYRGPAFAVKCALNQRRKSYRVAVVVSRKVNKSAVARNRIRRRLYEAIRLLPSEIAQPYDIVINVFNDSIIDQPFGALQAQLNKQLHEAGVLDNHTTP